MSESIIVALIAFAGSLIGNYFANNKTRALIEYRLQQLEAKQDKHNTVVERMYKTESDLQTVFVKIDELREDVNKLEK